MIKLEKINQNDPFGFNKAINWDKLNDPEVLNELEKLLEEEKKEKDETIYNRS
jgi:hypothetical protein